jgi:hypothetical protein
MSGQDQGIMLSWSKYGGILIAGPAVADVGGTPTYFVLGTDGQVYTGPSPGTFSRTKWACVGHPAAVKVATTTYFACHGQDDAVWYDTFTGGIWGGPNSLSGLAIDGVGIAGRGGVVTFWVKGADRQAWSRSLSSSWTTIGGILTYGIGVAPA